LFWEYFKLNFAAPNIGRRTLMVIVLCHLSNVYLFLQLYVNVYLVDVLFNTSEKESEAKLLLPDRKDTAICIGILYIAPMLIVHYWDYKKINLDVSGLSREYLSVNMFRKYLNFNQASRQ